MYVCLCVGNPDGATRLSVDLLRGRVFKKFVGLRSKVRPDLILKDPVVQITSGSPVLVFLKLKSKRSGNKSPHRP